jgi:hypothetical protein
MEEIDIGHGIRIMFETDGCGIFWAHAGCRGWFPLRFAPDPQSTGHRLSAGGKEFPERLTIEGSLLCPKGCGAHGFIRDGKWVAA